MDTTFKRIQVATPGYATYSNKSTTKQPKISTQSWELTGFSTQTPNTHAHPGGIFEPKPYIKSAINLFEHIR
ncbi:MAG: hypothetical protein CM1200mP3_07730 [Chloroflexota bacterium]|nr:MAG: hypothetical protein CM1200mP3_07730 [Chloroflexota bacterium]